MVASWWGACVRGGMRVGEIRACLSLSPPPTPTMYTKWTGWYRIEKAANTRKGGKFRVTAASTSGRLLTGQQQWTRSCCEMIGGIDALKLWDSVIQSCCDWSHLIQHFPGVWSWKTNSCSRLDQWSGRESCDHYSYVSFQHFTRKGSVTKHWTLLSD